MTRSCPGQAGRQGPPVGAISPSDHRGRDRGYRGGIPNLFQEACKNCSTKNWNILRPPWNLVRLKNSGMLLIEGKGREMTLCRSENLISGESAQIAQWIADVFFVVSFNKAPSTACSGEENKVVRDCEQFEKNEFMLYSLVELMKIKGLHD